MDSSLVSTDWLASELAADDLVVLDCTVWLEAGPDGFRSVSGRADYDQGHIPGAAFADLTGDLSNPSSPWRFGLPAPDAFCEAMGRLGVDDDRRAVLYDDNGSMWAARVWWMLRWVGFDRAALLDGGMTAWRDEGRPVDTGPPRHDHGRLTPRPRPALVADKADVLSGIGHDRVCLVDALPGALYRGETTAYRRAGHIPGATNTPAHLLIDRDTAKLAPIDELRTRFDAPLDARVITYCGGGIAASLDAFVLTRLGYTDVAVYTASLQEWAADPDAPLVVDG